MTTPANSWHLLRTQARREFTVDRYLRDRGVECYLPLHRVGLQSGAPIQEPFFPTYIFFRFREGAVQWPLVRWAPGTRQVVSFEDRPATVPEALLQTIRDRLARPDRERGACPFQPGDRVRVAKGAFGGLDAIFDAKISGARRAIILIDLLGRPIRTQVPIEQLRAAP